MLSDDTYRAKLQQTMASLKAWTGFVADVARVEEATVGSAWRIAIFPKAANACPVEIVLRQDQRFDISIGEETYEDQVIQSLDMFLPLLEAVADGRVVTRRTASAATGLLHSVATIVDLSDGSQYARVRANPATAGLSTDGTEAIDTHYLPYRRGET